MKCVFVFVLKGDLFVFFQYFIWLRFICRPSDSTASEDAGIEPRTVATSFVFVARHPEQAVLVLITNSC